MTEYRAVMTTAFRWRSEHASHRGPMCPANCGFPLAEHVVRPQKRSVTGIYPRLTAFAPNGRACFEILGDRGQR